LTSFGGSNPPLSVPAGCAYTLAGVPKTVRQVEKILRAHGWTLERTVGSHRQYVHPDNPNVVTVPGAPGKEVATGTLSSIRRASGIKELR
jgi:predicted RNA binding protein YcfA (HicA-like mRNA interferase family)